MIHKNNDPSLGYFVINTNHGGLVFHEPSQKIKAYEREATEADITAGGDAALILVGRKQPPPAPDLKPGMDLSALVSVKSTGTVE